MPRRAVVTVSIVGLLAVGVFFSDTGAAQKASPIPSSAVDAATTSDADARAARTLLDRYCIGCHNGRLKTAGLVLDREAIDLANAGAAVDVWEKVARKMRSRAMPPA